jgi:shikimate kinase
MQVRGTPSTGDRAVARHIVLVGLMGVGKTTTGVRLAERLGRRLVDSDHLIEATTGQTVREIFADQGEPAFRALEEAALLEALAEPEPLVIAAAGGVVMSPANRAALCRAQAFVVWLQADLDVLAQRAVTDVHRPLLDDDPAGTLARMATDRAEWYAEVADVSVVTTDRTPDEVVDEVLGVLGAEHG